MESPNDNPTATRNVDPPDGADTMTSTKECAVDRIVSRRQWNQFIKCWVHWYDYQPSNDTFDQLTHIPQNFTARYWKRTQRYFRFYRCATKASKMIGPQSASSLYSTTTVRQYLG